MATYKITIDERTKRGKALLAVIKNSKDVTIITPDAKENEALGRIGMEALQDPDNTQIEINEDPVGYFKKLCG